MKKIVGFGVLLAIVAVAVVYFARLGGASTTVYRFVTVEQGDLEAVVSSTGNLNAVTTVQVGTQVSGQISHLFVDFNDQVTTGQLIARIDPVLLEQQVREAEVSVERSKAELANREREFQRTAGLYEGQGVTEQEYDTAEYNLALARASSASAEISLERARRNLGYSYIYAPIDGIVIERNVELGQTVAASLSTPQLFLIANDLAELEILASVDESDIGLIEEGQTARFTVQAYPDDRFDGTVRQVRLQSAIQENVVNYTVVVNVQNPDGKLLPGMTATVDFLVETATDVLKVPNAALRFQPNEEMMTEFRERMMAERESRQGAGEAEGRQRPATEEGAADADEESTDPHAGASTEGMPEAFRERMAQMRAGGGQAGAAMGGAMGERGGFQGRPDVGTIWYLDESGQLAVARVRIGITDGQSTQITGRDIQPGLQAIAGVTVSSSSEGPNNPFQQQQSGRRFGPGF